MAANTGARLKEPAAHVHGLKNNEAALAGSHPSQAPQNATARTGAPGSALIPVERVEAPDLPVREALIVSEVRFVCDSIAEALVRQTRIRIRGQAATLADALGRAETMQKGILLLDVSFAGGTRTAARLCRALPAVNVIVLEVPEIEEMVLAWAETGIAGYVPNTASVNDLVLLIDRISRGEQSCPSHIAGGLLRRIGAGGSGLIAPKRPPSQSLTRREVEIFHLIGDGLSNKDIARRLSISVTTTKTHVHNLLTKLNIQRRIDVVARLRGHAPGRVDLIPPPSILSRSKDGWSIGDPDQ